MTSLKPPSYSEFVLDGYMENTPLGTAEIRAGGYSPFVCCARAITEAHQGMFDLPDEIPSTAVQDPPEEGSGEAQVSSSALFAHFS